MLLTEKVHHNRLNNKSMAVVFTKCVICNDAYKKMEAKFVNYNCKYKSQ